MADERPIDEQNVTPASDASGAAPVPSRPRRSTVSDHPLPGEPAPAEALEGEVVSGVPSGHLELVEQSAHDVTVGTLSIRQGGVNVANADSIDIRQGGITRAEARDISVVQGGIAIARADRVSVGMGGIGLALGGEVDVTRGFARTVVGRDVHIEQAGARTVIANKATFDRSSGALIVIAAKAEGNVRTLLDWRGALAFGAAFGILAGLVRRIRR
jgi:hypothetical protein